MENGYVIYVETKPKQHNFGPNVWQKERKNCRFGTVFWCSWWSLRSTVIWTRYPRILLQRARPVSCPMFYSVRHRSVASPCRSLISHELARLSHPTFLGFHPQVAQNPTAKPQPHAQPYPVLLSRWQMYLVINISLVYSWDCARKG
jgi:hypothetical protein